MTTRGRRLARALGALLIFALLVPATASAQVTRTYVDIVAGSDVNDCTRAAPCATFQRAHDATVPNGEVNAVTPGHYSAVIINKPITIDGNGTGASITPRAAPHRTWMFPDEARGTPGNPVILDARPRLARVDEREEGRCPSI